MFNKRHTYQYGSDPKHTIKLTPVEAHAVNNIRLFEVVEDAPGEIQAKINVHEIDIDAYNRAADKLNAYIVEHGGSIPCTDTWLEDHDILTRIK